MSTTLLISFISYSAIALISILFGLIYLFRDRFMPYHSEALELSWSDLKPNLQILILALMRAAAGGFIATGLVILILLIILFRAGEIWSIYTIPIISCCTSIGTLYATLLVKTKTPGNPPFILSLITLILTATGFISSMI